MKGKMKTLFKRAVSIVCATAMVVTGMVSDLGSVVAKAEAAHTMWVVGDSTVCAFSDAYYYPRYGYGTQIVTYLDDTYTVNNLAVSGTSSKSFTTHANYGTLTSGIQAGDVLVIGFGHNDEKAEDTVRFTSATGDYQTEGSIAKSLYDNYVKMAQDKGAEVVLCTPIVRRSATGSYTGSVVHVTDSGDYAAAIKQLGADVNVPVVDLTTLTKDLWSSLTPADTLKFHAWGNKKEGSVDNTHLSIYGAKMVAYLFANALKDTTAAVAAHVDMTAGAPTEADWIPNPDFVEKPYSNVLAQSTLWSDYTVGDVSFKGTVFGYIGSASKSYYTIEADADNNMHLVAKENKSKIQAASDGVAMYYYKVPVGKQFSLSAKATINTAPADKQSAFGLMARDDMYIDYADQAIASSYVVAGSLGSGSVCNCFYRREAVLGNTTNAPSKTTIAAGDVYDLSIVSNSDGYTCKFGNEPAQSAGFDFQLVEVDSDFVYVGMFVSRSADVTFSSIVLTVDGETIVDTRANDVTKYSIAVEESENGVATSDVAIAKVGDKIQLSATAGKGYMFDKWTVTPSTVEIAEDNSFTMPASNVSVRASFKVDPDYVAVGGPIQVWDFAGVEEPNTTYYTNNITASDIITSGLVSAGGDLAVTGNTTFGSLTMNTVAKDRLYTNVAALSTYSKGSTNYITKYTGSSFIKADGSTAEYTSGGAWYCNGARTSASGHVTLTGVKAGDRIDAYMGIFQNDNGVFAFKDMTNADGQEEKVDATTTKYERYSFVAEKDGDYKIYEVSGGKPLYHRIVKYPATTVSGTITMNGLTIPAGAKITFINDSNKQKTDGTITGSTFTAKLAPGFTYTATITGATGLGFTNASKHVTVAETDILEGKKNVALSLEEKSTYVFSGSLKGFATDYSLDDLAISMIPDPDAQVEEVELVIDKTAKTFSATLAPDVDYTIEMSGAYDYEVTSAAVVNQNQNYAADITVALRAKYTVTGKFTGLAEGAKVTALTFKNVDDKYTYTANVTDDGYSIELRDGSYLAEATVSGYSTQTHVVVAGKTVAKDLMFVSTTPAGAVEKVSDIYVGYPKMSNNFDTVKEAVAYAARMNPSSEADRVTIHIAPGTYREQIIVETPYISFVNDTNKEVLLTWYYGIGYKYYSAAVTGSSKGYYSEESAYDKFDKGIAERWGTCVNVKSAAKAFRATGITFENSFNRYVTDEEIEDGVEPSGLEKINVVRNYSTDVQSKAATERGAALCVDADECEFVDCKFYGSQDTLYAAGAHGYFKNCFIEGMTDYIFGSGNSVFDSCELSFKGYSNDNSTGGYITAHKPGSDSEKGYLFRNCTVTANDKLTVATGSFGRPWGANAKVTFLNTKLQKDGLITAAGWTDWNTTTLAKNANYFEYNTTMMDGTAVSTAGRVRPVMTDAEAAACKVADFFGSWVPVSYVDTDAIKTATFKTKPYLVDNGDINAPFPGHTLTAAYALNEGGSDVDVSVIKWYRIKNEQETLICTSNATLGATYKLTSDDIGAEIKIVVTPALVNGVVGEAESFTMAEKVRDGFDDPSGMTDITLGDGVNIFLAGDSTVKDYDASGMYSSGKSSDLGSWGEFLQYFFDKDKVTIANYANGGRSTRNYINEGTLDKIAENIKEGDYLFIQFGHNDCANGAGYLEDRYVPLGNPDANGVFPVTAGSKVATPDSLKSKYGDTFYSYDCGGTFKWYLKQYVDVAKNAGATPVLVTPVSRMYYNSDGTIKAHHDSTDTSTKTYVSSNNAYVTAVKQLGSEEGVLVIDAFDFTKTMFEDAYKAGGSKDNGAAVMGPADTTHCNKLGGVIEAALFAQAIQNTDLNIAKTVKMPSKVIGLSVEGKQVFSINSTGKLVAYNIADGYTTENAYWNATGQALIDAISAKAAELNPTNPGTGDDGPGTGDNPGSNDGDDPVPPEEGEFAIFGLRKEYSFTGAKIIPDIYVMYGEKILAPGVDYTVSYKNNTKPGTAELLISGKGNYAGKGISKTFDIKDVVETGLDVIDLTGAKIAKIPAVEFVPGKAWFPDLSITFKKGETPKVYTYDGKKYVTEKGEVLPAYVAVSNNVNKGTATILLTGAKTAKGKVTTLKATFKINAVDLAKAKAEGKVEVSAADATYSPKGAVSEEICVKYNGKTLVNGTDYTVKYSANKKAGTAVATITGKGNYAKKLTANYQVKKLDMSEVQVIAVKATTGMKAGKVTAVVVDGNGDALKASQYRLVKTTTDGTILEDKDVLEDGQEIRVMALAKDFANLENQTVKYDFTVGADFSKAKASIVKVGKATKTFTYTGVPVELTEDDLVVTIKENKVDKTLKLGENYEIAGYTANINKGTATVILKGINGYSGMKTVKFKITGRTIELK